MNRNGSYQFEHLEGRHQEAAFLAERAQMRLGDFTPLLQRHGIPQNGKTLDIGCGQGLRSRLIAERFPEMEVLGIDRSSELLASAANFSPQPSNLSFSCEDLYNLPYAKNSFDFIYARLVFMHLNRPLLALEKLRDLLKPGGRLLIEDADRDCMFFEPAPASLAHFWAKVQEGQRRLGGDPNVGRKLASYLGQTGFEKIQIETQPIVSGGGEIAFLARTLLSSLNIYLPSEDRAQGEIAIQDLEQLALNPDAHFYHFWFVVSGEKK